MQDEQNMAIAEDERGLILDVTETLGEIINTLRQGNAVPLRPSWLARAASMPPSINIRTRPRARAFRPRCSRRGRRKAAGRPS